MARRVTASSAVRDAETCEVDVVHLAAVREARLALPADEGLARVAELLALLTSPTRLKVLLALRAAARGRARELCVCDLAVVTSVSKSLTSHQLRLLRAAGLVAVRRSGKLAYYRLADGGCGELLTEVQRMSRRGVYVFTTRERKANDVSAPAPARASSASRSSR